MELSNLGGASAEMDGVIPDDPNAELEFSDVLSDQYSCQIDDVRMGAHTGVSFFKVTVKGPEGNSWEVQHRFSEFEHLKYQLGKDNINAPDFPRKHMFRRCLPAAAVALQSQSTALQSPPFADSSFDFAGCWLARCCICLLCRN